MRRASLLFLAVAACQSSQPSPDHEAAAQRVVAGLRHPVAIGGESTATMSLADRMAHYHVPGVSIAVVDGGRLVWARGVGVREAGMADSVTAETRFQAASISKPVTATAMLRLVEEGRLALDQDVNTYLTSWQVPASPYTSTSKVTLRRIASHSAGLTVHGFPGYAVDVPRPSVPAILDGSPPANTGPVRVDTVPGTRWRYSGGGTTVMQLVITDVTGQPFAEVMASQVLGPLGMVHSSFAQPLLPAWEGMAASGHRADGTMVAGRWHIYPEQAAAGLWTTPSDLMRWAMGIDAARRGAPGAILRQSTAQEMLTVQSGTFGLGPTLTGAGDSLRFSHGGSNEGYRAEVVFFPATGQGAAVMTNGDNGSSLIQEILLALAAEYRWPGFHARSVRRAPMDAVVLASLAGTYLLEYQGQAIPVVLRQVEGGLVSDIPAEGVTGDLLVPVGASRFVSLGRGTEFEFRGDTLVYAPVPALSISGIRAR